MDEKENEINAETGFDFRRTGHFQFVLVSVLVSWSGMQLFGTRGEPLEKREKANKINGFMRVASDVEKRREMGQIGIFSPLFYDDRAGSRSMPHNQVQQSWLFQR